MPRPVTRIQNGLLHVDRTPFIVVGAEVHNSSTSTPAAIERSFGAVAALGANTVLAAVAWDLFEPQEGEFDVGLVDHMLRTAREVGLRLVPLWFGSWKNGVSTYAPSWVKKDTGRFPRAVTGTSPVEVLSAFSVESRQADARAFARLMSHLASSDTDGTVVMVQVENEVGLLGDSRDRGESAEAAWRGDVPSAVIDAVRETSGLAVHESWVSNGSRTSGSWAEVFGDGPDADEAFMAAAYATYVDAVAASGRAELDVPMFVNIWQDTPPEFDLPEGAVNPMAALAGGQSPGVYPSGGAVRRVAGIWRALAPNIDFLAPDIYFGDFNELCSDYRDASGVLFIPEMRRDQRGVSQMFVAIGEHRAAGVSPFGVDSLTELPQSAPELADAYRLLRVAAAALENQLTANARGFAVDANTDQLRVEMGEYIIHVSARNPFAVTPPENAYGILIEEAPGTYLAIGRGLTFSFSRADGRSAGLLAVSEISGYGSTSEVVLRRNGDETVGGKAVRLPPLTPPASVFAIPFFEESTGIVRIELYTWS